jgi:hypothetical protein
MQNAKCKMCQEQQLGKICSKLEIAIQWRPGEGCSKEQLLNSKDLEAQLGTGVGPFSPPIRTAS